MDLKNIRDFKISPDGEKLLIVTFDPKDLYIYKIKLKFFINIIINFIPLYQKYFSNNLFHLQISKYLNQLFINLN